MQMQKVGDQNVQGFLCKRCKCSCNNQMKMNEFKHAMVKIKHGITTDLPVGKGSKLESFERDILFPSTWVKLDENFQSGAPQHGSCRKNLVLFDRVELLMILIILWYCPKG